MTRPQQTGTSDAIVVHCVGECVCVCVWKKEYTQVHTGVGEIVSAVPTIDSKRNAHILITLLRHLA